MAGPKHILLCVWSLTMAGPNHILAGSWGSWYEGQVPPSIMIKGSLKKKRGCARRNWRSHLQVGWRITNILIAIDLVKKLIKPFVHELSYLDPCFLIYGLAVQYWPECQARCPILPLQEMGWWSKMEQSGCPWNLHPDLGNTKRMIKINASKSWWRESKVS